MDQADSHKKLCVHTHVKEEKEPARRGLGGILIFSLKIKRINSILVLLIKIFTMRQLQQIFYCLSYNF